jgi:hypothetical protein
VQRTHARITAPGEDQLLRAAHPDHLVVYQVRSHANERQTLPLLPNYLVRRRKRYQMREAFQGYHVSVLNQLGNRFPQTYNLSHVVPLPAFSFSFFILTLRKGTTQVSARLRLRASSPRPKTAPQSAIFPCKIPVPVPRRSLDCHFGCYFDLCPILNACRGYTLLV